MLQPLLRAFSQLDDPVFLGVVWRSLGWSFVAFVLVLAGSIWLLQDWVAQAGWLGWVAGALGGLGALFLAVWLYVPVALVIATLYVDRVASTVERRFYPGLPRPVGAGLSDQGWDGLVLGLQLLAWQIVALLLSILLPGVGLVFGYLLTGWAIGRGLYVSVAMRRMSRGEAIASYRARWFAVVGPGVALALASSLPPLNLLVPVVGIAAMVHVSHRASRTGL